MPNVKGLYWQVLSAYDAHFDVMDRTANTPIHYAAMGGHALCVRFLAQRGKVSLTISINFKQDAVLSQGGPRDATVNFDTYRILQQHRAVSLSSLLTANVLLGDPTPIPP